MTAHATFTAAAPADARPARRACNNDAAVAAFIDAKADIDAALEQLQAATEAHFGADPETLDWSHAEALQRVAHLLGRAAEDAAAA
ncbi:MAG: hypothetical protein ACU0BF_03845 [Paracoccaceae bacterium]